MSRYLLDTNIISNATKPLPSQSLMDWLADQPDESLFIASWTIAEIQRGILEKPSGKKRKLLEAWFAGPDGPLALFAGRILPFDHQASLIWGKLMSSGTKAGKPRSALDMIVAATALANQCTIVTGNEKDFASLPIFNPMRPPASPNSP